MGIINKIIPQYTDTVDGIKVSKIEQTPTSEKVILDDFYDALFNKSAREYLTAKYGNPVLGTIAGEFDYIGSIFDKNNYGKFGPGMNILSHFGRTMDKTEDFLIGGLTEGLNTINQINPLANADKPENPIKNIFINDEDYTGNRLFAAMGNSISRLAGNNLKLNESDFGKAWIPANIGAELITDPGILGSNISKMTNIASPIKYFGQQMSNLDDLAAHAVWETTIPGGPEALRKGIDFLMQLAGGSSPKAYANFAFPEDDTATKQAPSSPTSPTSPDNIVSTTSTDTVARDTSTFSPPDFSMFSKDWQSFLNKNASDPKYVHEFINFMNLGNKPIKLASDEDAIHYLQDIGKASTSKYTPMAELYTDIIIDNLSSYIKRVEPTLGTIDTSFNEIVKLNDELYNLQRKIKLSKNMAGTIDLSKPKKDIMDQFNKINSNQTYKTNLIDDISKQYYDDTAKGIHKNLSSIFTKDGEHIDMTRLTKEQRDNLETFQKSTTYTYNDELNDIVELIREIGGKVEAVNSLSNAADIYNKNAFKLFIADNDIVPAVFKKSIIEKYVNNGRTDIPWNYLIPAFDASNEDIISTFKQYNRIFDMNADDTVKINEKLDSYINRQLTNNAAKKLTSKSTAYMWFTPSNLNMYKKYWTPIAKEIQKDYYALNDFIPTNLNKSELFNPDTIFINDIELNKQIHKLFSGYLNENGYITKGQKSKIIQSILNPDKALINDNTSDYVLRAQKFGRTLSNIIDTAPNIVKQNMYPPEFQWMPNLFAEAYFRFKPYENITSKFNISAKDIISRDEMFFNSPQMLGVVRNDLKKGDNLNFINANKDYFYNPDIKPLLFNNDGKFIGYPYAEGIYNIFDKGELNIHNNAYLDIHDYSKWLDDNKLSQSKYVFVINGKTENVSLNSIYKTVTDPITKQSKQVLDLGTVPDKLKGDVPVIDTLNEFQKVRDELQNITSRYTNLESILNELDTASVSSYKMLKYLKMLKGIDELNEISTELDNLNTSLTALMPKIHQSYSRMIGIDNYFKNLKNTTIVGLNPRVKAWEILTDGFFNSNAGYYTKIDSNKKINRIFAQYNRNTKKYYNYNLGRSIDYDNIERFRKSMADFENIPYKKFNFKYLYKSLENAINKDKWSKKAEQLASTVSKGDQTAFKRIYSSNMNKYVDYSMSQFLTLDDLKNINKAINEAVPENFNFKFDALKEGRVYGKDLFKFNGNRSNINADFNIADAAAELKDAFTDINKQLGLADDTQIAKAYVMSFYAPDSIEVKIINTSEFNDYLNNSERTIFNTAYNTVEGSKELDDLFKNEELKRADVRFSDDSKAILKKSAPTPLASSGGGGGTLPPHHPTGMDAFDDYNPNLPEFNKPDDLISLVSRATNIHGRNSLRDYTFIHRVANIRDHIKISKFLSEKLTSQESDAIIRAFEGLQDIKINGNYIKDLAQSGGYKMYAGLSDKAIADIQSYTDIINNICKTNLLSTEIRNINNNHALYVFFTKNVNLKKAIKNFDDSGETLPTIILKHGDDKSLDKLRQWAIDNRYINILDNWDVINKWYTDFQINLDDIRKKIGLPITESGYIHHAMLDTEDATKAFYNYLDLSNIENFIDADGKSKYVRTGYEYNARLIADSIRKHYNLNAIFDTYNVQRKFVGDLTGLNTLTDTPLFSNNLEYITRKAYTNGFMDNSMLQTTIQIDNNPYFHLQSLGFKNTEDGAKQLQALLNTTLSSGAKSGNKANIILGKFVYDDAGKFKEFKRFNTGSLKQIQQAINDNALMIPVNLMSKIDFPIQKYYNNNNKVWRAWNKILSFGKAAYLTSPGFLVGNAADAYTKLIVNLGAKYDLNMSEIIYLVKNSDSIFKNLNNLWDKYYALYKSYLSEHYKGTLPYKYNIANTILKDAKERDKFIDYLTNIVKIPDEEYSKLRFFTALYNYQSTFEQSNDLNAEFTKYINKYDITDPLSKIINKILADNPISEKFLSLAGAEELRVRNTSIIADLLMHYNGDYDELLKIFRKVPTDNFKQAGKQFTSNLDESLNFMNSFNYDYENRPKVLQAASKIIPFPIYFIKNIVNWLHMLQDNPELVDTLLTIQDGLWSDDEDKKAVKSDEFAAEAKGRGAIPFGHKSSKFIKGYVKPSPLQSFFGAFNTLNNPIQDVAYRVTPSLAPITHHLQNSEDVKYRPYGTSRYDKNVKKGDKNFSAIRYTFHRLNPYERLIQNFSRLPDKVKHKDAQISDFSPSMFQPNFSKPNNKQKKKEN